LTEFCGKDVELNLLDLDLIHKFVNPVTLNKNMLIGAILVVVVGGVIFLE